MAVTLFDAAQTFVVESCKSLLVFQAKWLRPTATERDGPDYYRAVCSRIKPIRAEYIRLSISCSLSSGSERGVEVFECDFLLQWFSFEKELFLLRDSYSTREDLRLGVVDA